jgi:hypothetical protein
MLKVALFLLAAVVLGLLLVLGLALTKPDTFTVQRSARLSAAPDAVFPLLNDFRRWPEWSPWEGIDPSMQRQLSGAASGVGAVYAWSGTGKAGAGRMEILESSAASRLVIQLDFIKPFAAHNRTEFTLTPAGGGTELRWTMTGPAPLVSKVMQVFADLDTMIGKDFEAGLAKLQSASAKP